MTGSGNNGSAPENNRGRKAPTNKLSTLSGSDLRGRAHLLSRREQLYSNHFLYERYYAASARLIQAVGQGDVFEAIGEILGALIGCEEVAIFLRGPDGKLFTAWSTGVSDDELRELGAETDLVGYAIRHRATQLDDRQGATLCLSSGKQVTSWVALRSGREVIGVIVLLNLLPQKKGLEWVDHELLKLLETYGTVAIELQFMQKDLVIP